MKRLIFLSMFVFVIAAFALAPAFTPAFADGPCDNPQEPGYSGYASGHIVPLAKAGGLGFGGHIPGGHNGNSICVP